MMIVREYTYIVRGPPFFLSLVEQTTHGEAEILVTPDALQRSTLVTMFRRSHPASKLSNTELKKLGEGSAFNLEKATE